MEKIITAEERIRRAEEIYNRRKMQNGVRVSTSNVNTKMRPEYSLFKKMALQILICLLIYFCFYMIKNSNYIFSEDLLNKTRNFLSYDINLNAIYNDVKDNYNNLKAFLDIKNNEEEVDKNTNIETNETFLNEVQNSETLKIENNVEEIGVGGR